MKAAQVYSIKRHISISVLNSVKYPLDVLMLEQEFMLAKLAQALGYDEDPGRDRWAKKVIIRARLSSFLGGKPDSLELEMEYRR